MAERTNSERLFQRDEAQEWKALAPVLILTLGTDRLLSLLDLSEQGGSDAAIKRNSVLSGFSFGLFVNIHEWTEAKYD